MDPNVTTSHRGVWSTPATSVYRTGVRTLPKFLTHSSFYWGHHAEVLFPGWPGTSPAMYALSLIFVFALAVLVEWLVRCDFLKHDGVAAKLMQTAVHTVRSGFSYMVVLAVMSFNGGIFLAAVAGHALGFVVFGIRASRSSGGSDPDKRPGLSRAFVLIC